MEKDLEPMYLYDDKFLPLPPNKTQLRLYGHPCCAFTERVRLTLALKKIPYQYVTIDFASRPDWFKKIGSEGRVPLLELKNREEFLYESMPVVNYVEESTENLLLPKDLIEKTKVRMLCSVIESIPTDFYTVLKSFGKNKDALKNLKTYYSKLEAKLGENKKGKFLLDYEHPTVADIVLFVHFRRAVLFEGTECDEAYKEINFSTYPKLMKWLDDMMHYGPIANHVVDKANWACFLKYFKDTTKFEFRYPWPQK